MAKNSFGMMITPSIEAVDGLWKGSYDMHIHCAPDPSTTRRYDILDCAKAAAEGGMKGIVMKSFFYNTTTPSRLAMRMYPEVSVCGSVVIGELTTGGLTYAARIIESEAKLGCKVVWFPAFDAAWQKKWLHQEGGIYVLDKEGNLKKEVYDILEVIRKYDLVLCSGHMSVPEIHAVFRSAKEMGITKLVTTHALVNQYPSLTREEMQTCIDLGAVIELVFMQTMPRCGSMDPRRYVEEIKALGAEHFLMGTDFGQVTEASPAEGMRNYIGMMLQFGCSEEEVRWMCRTNPARLLGDQ